MVVIFSERNLAAALVVGIVAGIALGLMAQGTPADSGLKVFLGHFSLFGKLFLGALKMVVVPLVLFSVTSGIANLGGVGAVGRKMGKTLAYFAATSFFAVLVGMVFTNVIRPGGGMEVENLYAALPSSEVESARDRQGRVALSAPSTLGEFVSVQIDNIFANPFESLAKMNLIGVVFFGMFLGLMILASGEKGRPAAEFFTSVNEALMRMVRVVIWLAPLGVMSLAASMLATLGPEVLRPLMRYFLTVTLALATQFFIVYPALLWFLCGYSPWRFLVGMQEAILMALTTASSAATLPVTLRCVEEHLGVDNRSANFVLPMGATINMDGTALYEAVAAIFIAQLLGMELGFAQQVIIFFTATLAAVGAAGIPQAGLVTMVVVFNAVGIPLEYMALIIIVDRPLDHLRTVVNVTGDATGAVFLSSSEGEMAART